MKNTKKLKKLRKANKGNESFQKNIWLWKEEMKQVGGLYNEKNDI